MNNIGMAIVIRTQRHIHILCGVKEEFGEQIKINECIPSFMISENISPEGEISNIVITKNPKKEMVNLSPTNWTINNNSTPKSISLAGKRFPAEEIISIKKIPVKLVRPRDMRI